MLETYLDPEELEQRKKMAEDVEPMYEKHMEYQQKKEAMILAALSNQGFYENEKKNCIRQGVVQMKNETGEWKKSFILLKPYGATYHESGRHFKKGFINLKLARVESSSKSQKRFKIITPMATYNIKARHEVDCEDWIAALTAACQGKKEYVAKGGEIDELDNTVAVALRKPYLMCQNPRNKWKIVKDCCIIGRSSACGVVLQDKKISREHCKIENKGGGKWMLQDMGSNSGTKLNGKKVTQSFLKHNDVIEIGNTVLTFGGKK